MPALLTRRWTVRVPLEDARRHRLDRVAVADVAELDLGAELVRERAQPVLTARDEDAVPAPSA